MPHLLISAAHKSSGKTTLSIGVCAALRRRGRSVQPFKKGPDYIDPMWLARASGRDCHNLDFYLQDNDEILRAFVHYSGDADFSLVEGNKGLYDGLDLEGSNSNAALATLLGAPVVLVIDSRGMTRGIAPLILGYQAFGPDVNIAGVILNHVGGSRHEGKLRAIIEHYTDVPVLGAVHHDNSLAIVERHLGLMPSNEDDAATTRIAQIASAVSDQVDLERLITVAGGAPAPDAPPAARHPHRVRPPDVRIGLMRDQAFGFYYPGDLQALQAAGAEIVAIDSLNDRQLPALDGLFIGGGFPETCMGQLEANASLRAAIRAAIDAGLPVYAECGGLMYLARSLTWGDKRCEMVGAIAGDIVMHTKPQGRGYVRLRETGCGPWPLRNAQGGLAEFPAHEFHYSRLENLADDFACSYAFEVLRGTGIDGKNDGIVYRNMLACYTHQRDVGNNHWTSRFVDFVRDLRHRTTPAVNSRPSGRTS